MAGVHNSHQMPEFCQEGDDAGSDTVPPWVRVVLNAIENNDEVEATHTQHLWAMIVAHTDLFYPYRHLLADWLVKSSGRVLGQVNPQVRVCALVCSRAPVSACVRACVRMPCIARAGCGAARHCTAPSEEGHDVEKLGLLRVVSFGVLSFAAYSSPSHRPFLFLPRPARARSHVRLHTISNRRRRKSC
jgi:hypothetical protein